MAVVHFEGQDYNFDIEALDLAQARSIKRQTGMSIRKLLDGLADLDPEALAALYWLMLAQNGKATDISKVNFKILEFGVALNDAMGDEEAEEENPTETAGEPSLTNP